MRVVCGRLQCEATSLKRDRAGGRTRGADNGDNDGMSMEHDTVIEDTRNWMVKAVIGVALILSGLTSIGWSVIKRNKNL